MSNLADLGLGPIDQVAYIVEDMERAIPRYEALFGPFTASAQSSCPVSCNRLRKSVRPAPTMATRFIGHPQEQDSRSGMRDASQRLVSLL